MLADPRALQYILHTSGYRFPKSTDSQQITTLQFGRGVEGGFVLGSHG